MPDRTRPEQALWLAVLYRAIEDATGRNPRHRQTALQFLESRWFVSVLELAGLDRDLADVLREAVPDRQPF